ncbi:hypothetical protein INT45_007483 [Circinella minor]|uniref:Uncharacterized protein n=1 Tax=Circinella minor TaxID=1195481 RepID=A0A8H7SG36_9FUNG|nr:hypothetical protein INT45_007483 [Circinella minor]
MEDITREQAICMFYNVEFNHENAARLLKRMDDLGELDICFENDYEKHVLVTRKKILAEPHHYKRYRSSTGKEF